MFSVIVTTCNRDPKIVKEALQSVLAQSYKNFEIIVVNDAPNYEKREDLEYMIVQLGSNIKYIVNRYQKGANYARNIGAKAAKGDYLSFLDDDDYWDSKRLEKMKKEFDNHADIVYSDFIIFSEKKKTYSKRDVPNKNDVVKELLAFNYLGGFSNVSFRKDLFFKVGALDESLPSYQDQDLFIRLVKEGIIACISEPLSYYRITSNSISLNGEKKLRGFLMFMENYKDIFDIYPESKIIRLENELVYSEKQGWVENSRVIAKMLKGQVSLFKIMYLRLKGKCKYFAIGVLKMQ